MIAGMGSLMGLCPQPEEWTIVDWCKPFGILPTRLEAEDWKYLQVNAQKEWLTSWYQRWNEVAGGKGGSMPQDVVQYLLKLSDEAEEKWRTSDSD